MTLEELEELPLVFYDRGSSDFGTLSSVVTSPRRTELPTVALEVETIEAAKRMVERKLGLSFLPLFFRHA